MMKNHVSSLTFALIDQIKTIAIPFHQETVLISLRHSPSKFLNYLKGLGKERHIGEAEQNFNIAPI